MALSETERLFASLADALRAPPRFPPILFRLQEKEEVCIKRSRQALRESYELLEILGELERAGKV